MTAYNVIIRNRESLPESFFNAEYPEIMLAFSAVQDKSCRYRSLEQFLGSVILSADAEIAYLREENGKPFLQLSANLLNPYMKIAFPCLRNGKNINGKIPERLPKKIELRYDSFSDVKEIDEWLIQVVDRGAGIHWIGNLEVD